MARGIYTVEFSAQDQTAADGNMDMFELRPGTDEPINLIGLFIHCTSEVGDAQEEGIAYQILRMTGGTLTSGTGGTTPTPVATDFGDSASTFAADAVNDAVATTTGTTTTLVSDGFNIRVGLDMWWPPESRLSAPGAAQAAILVRFNTTVADTVTWQGTAYVKEGT